MYREVRVFAPATIANLSVGFDILGLAIDKPGDEIVAKLNPNRKGIVITTISGTGDKELPYDIDKNTAGYAAKRLMIHLGKEDLGVELEIHKRMPFGSGLGSSAASAAGAVVAVNELLGQPMNRKDLLRFAVEGEQIADGAFHADNVAPSLLGGVILIRSNEMLDVYTLPFPEELRLVVVHPEIEILTRDARSVLSDKVNLSNAITQTANLASFITALFRNDIDLIAHVLKDVIIEPQRKQLIKGFDDVQQSAIAAGALGCGISGAGPSMFAFCKSDDVAHVVAHAMQTSFSNHSIGSKYYISPINNSGVTILERHN